VQHPYISSQQQLLLQTQLELLSQMNSGPCFSSARLLALLVPPAALLLLPLLPVG
jgi:hypothetical protein